MTIWLTDSFIKSLLILLLRHSESVENEDRILNFQAVQNLSTVDCRMHR